MIRSIGRGYPRTSSRGNPRSRTEFANSVLAPTAERGRHDPVERVEQAIADSSGSAARPYRVVDTLAVMERRGSITPGMRQAGEDFRRAFTTAQLDPLRALDWSRLRSGTAPARAGGEPHSMQIETARDQVWRAVLAVGGLGSAGGSCLWHVVGWERSLKEWAAEQGWRGRRVSQEAASGMLIAALGALETHYRPSVAKI